jgi:hypothetical protein
MLDSASETAWGRILHDPDPARIEEAKARLLGLASTRCYPDDVEALRWELEGVSQTETAVVLGMSQPGICYRRAAMRERMTVAVDLPDLDLDRLARTVAGRLLQTHGFKTEIDRSWRRGLLAGLYYLTGSQSHVADLIGGSQGRARADLEAALHVLDDDHPLGLMLTRWTYRLREPGEGPWDPAGFRGGEAGVLKARDLVERWG